MSTLARRWLRLVPALESPELRVSLVRREMETLHVDTVAVALDDVCTRAEQADPRAKDVIAAIVPTVVNEDFAAFVEAFRIFASQHALLALGRFLRTTRDAGEPPPSPDERPIRWRHDERPLTLGERKALARRPTRQAIEKLLRDPHPAVIRNLLSNPRITEDDVVRLAAKRPVYSDLLAEIARHPKWTSRVRVRMAILQNPSTPAQIAVPMVRLLVRPELLQIVQAVDVAPAVRAAATEALQRRPPVRGDASAEKH